MTEELYKPTAPRRARPPRSRFVVSVVLLSMIIFACLVPGRGQVDPQTPAALCASFTELGQLRHDERPVSVGSPIVVVLGDSYAQGLSLEDPRKNSWPTIVGKDLKWTTYVNAMSTTGYVNEGYCKRQDYPRRTDSVLAQHPQTVLIEGGLNDTWADSETVRVAASRVIGALRGVPRLVVIGPTMVPGAPTDEVRRVDGVLRDVTEAGGRQYVSALHWTYPCISDGIHPTAEGHKIYAHDVEAALAPLPR